MGPIGENCICKKGKRCVSKDGNVERDMCTRRNASNAGPKSNRARPSRKTAQQKDSWSVEERREHNERHPWRVQVAPFARNFFAPLLRKGEQAGDPWSQHQRGEAGIRGAHGKTPIRTPRLERKESLSGKAGQIQRFVFPPLARSTGVFIQPDNGEEPCCCCWGAPCSGFGVGDVDDAAAANRCPPNKLVGLPLER